jgi:hypothetical protein
MYDSVASYGRTECLQKFMVSSTFLACNLVLVHRLNSYTTHSGCAKVTKVYQNSDDIGSSVFAYPWVFHQFHVDSGT